MKHSNGVTPAATEPSSPAILRLDEVSARTGIPVGTLRYWRHLGIGPATYKLGRRVVCDAPVLEAWLAQQRQADRAAS